MKRLNMFTIGIIALLVSFFAITSVALAGDTVTGTVIQTDTGFQVQLADGSLINVQEDLSAMVGKKVKIIGTIQEGDAGKTIMIDEIEEIK